MCTHEHACTHTHSHTKQNVKRKRTCSVMRRWGKKAWGPVLPEHSPYLALGCTSTNPSSPRDYMVTCASYEIKSISQLYKKKLKHGKINTLPHRHTYTHPQTHSHIWSRSFHLKQVRSASSLASSTGSTKVLNSVNRVPPATLPIFL